MDIDDIKEVDKQPKSLGQRILHELFDLVKIFILCYVFVWVVTSYGVRPIHVEGSSMYPTLEDGEVGLTNVFGVKFGTVERFDVVIVHKVDKDELWVKRVIGMPGDTIYAQDDVLYINDIPQEETYLNKQYVDEMRSNDALFTDDFGPVTLKEDEYWLMGDNRPRSDDSRNPLNGPFKGKDLKGKQVYILYPFNKMKAVTN